MYIAQCGDPFDMRLGRLGPKSTLETINCCTAFYIIENFKNG